MPYPKRTMDQKFDRYVKRSEDGCWLYSGRSLADGYGLLYTSDGKAVLAHRWAYERFVAPIPAGMLVLHRCDTPRCCNPEHLFLGTHADNMRDMVAKGRHAQAAITACPQGHPYDAANTHIHADGGRRCRACDRERHRLAYERKKAAA